MAHHSVAVKQRIGPLLRLIRSAAVVDADGAALWALIQTDFHSNQRVIVESLVATGRLPRTSTSTGPPTSCGR